MFAVLNVNTIFKISRNRQSFTLKKPLKYKQELFTFFYYIGTLTMVPVVIYRLMGMILGWNHWNFRMTESSITEILKVGLSRCHMPIQTWRTAIWHRR